MTRAGPSRAEQRRIAVACIVGNFLEYLRPERDATQDVRAAGASSVPVVERARG
jgi:hypothetical protein